MQQSRNRHSTDFQIAIKLKTLSPEIIKTIPRSTRHDMRHREFASIIGIDKRGHEEVQRLSLLVNANQHAAASMKAFSRIFSLLRNLDVSISGLRHIKAISIRKKLVARIRKS